MTHKEKLLLMLEDGSWHCGEEFLEARFYTWSQRASDVNKIWPGRIVNRTCTNKFHHCDQYADSQRWGQLKFVDELVEKSLPAYPQSHAQ